MGGGGGQTQSDASSTTNTTTQSYADSFNKTVNLVANIAHTESYFLDSPGAGAPAASGPSSPTWTADTQTADGGFLGLTPLQLILAGGAGLVAVFLLLKK